MPASAKWKAIYPKLSRRVLQQGFVDISLRDDQDFSSLSETDFRDAAIHAFAYLARISQNGQRKVSYEEYCLVMQLALVLGIACGLSASALTHAEKSTTEKELVDLLKPIRTWLMEDVSVGPYSSVSAVWPFVALLRAFDIR